MEGWREEGRESWMDGGGPRRGRVHVALGPAETGLRGNCAHAASSYARLLTHAHSHAHPRTAELDALTCMAGRARTREDARGCARTRGRSWMKMQRRCLHSARHERRGMEERMLLRGVRVAQVSRMQAFARSRTRGAAAGLTAMLATAMLAA